MTPQTHTLSPATQKRTASNYVYGPGVPIGYQPPSRLTNCVYGPGVPIGYQPGAPITNSCNQYRHETGCHRGSVKLTPEITKHLTQSGYTQEEINKLGNNLPACKALPAGEERKAAENNLKKMAGKIQTNKASGIQAYVSTDSAGKIVSGNALGESFRNLVDSGFCDKDTAYKIHMSAAANIDTLFSSAPKINHQKVYHYEESRNAATHLYCPFQVDGVDKPVTADISVISFKGDNNQRIYSIGLRVQPPLPSSGISQQS